MLSKRAKLRRLLLCKTIGSNDSFTLIENTLRFLDSKFWIQGNSTLWPNRQNVPSCESLVALKNPALSHEICQSWSSKALHVV